MHIPPLVRFAATELSVPIILVKMHRRYRMPRLQGQLFSGVVSILNDFISETGTELSRSLT
jgi:hypothetical protein